MLLLRDCSKQRKRGEQKRILENKDKCKKKKKKDWAQMLSFAFYERGKKRWRKSFITVCVWSEVDHSLSNLTVCLHAHTKGHTCSLFITQHQHQSKIHYPWSSSTNQQLGKTPNLFDLYSTTHTAKGACKRVAHISLRKHSTPRQ